MSRPLSPQLRGVSAVLSALGLVSNTCPLGPDDWSAWDCGDAGVSCELTIDETWPSQGTPEGGQATITLTPDLPLLPLTESRRQNRSPSGGRPES